jgi:5'-nucleotidase (lipoprotein e(P4) family)
MILAGFFINTFKMKRFLLIITTALFTQSIFQSCTDSSASGSNKGNVPSVSTNDHLVMPAVFHQKAAEYRALCYQAFSIARLRLDNSLRIMGLQRQQAIVVDIDETVLDNSPYEAKCILDGISYPAFWDEWIDQASASSVPGSLDFLQYAGSKNIEVYYITNRKEKYRQQTLKNLQTAGFPYADSTHLLMRTDRNGKESRRKKVAETRSVILLIGDNLNDFSDIFEQKSVNERFEMTDSLKNEFGNRFIVLPNVMYGDWESALYDYRSPLTEAEKDSLRRMHLVGF